MDFTAAMDESPHDLPALILAKDNVRSGMAERKVEASKLYADFIWVVRKRG